jgi:hypothetical protein
MERFVTIRDHFSVYSYIVTIGYHVSFPEPQSYYTYYYAIIFFNDRNAFFVQTSTYHKFYAREYMREY